MADMEYQKAKNYADFQTTEVLFKVQSIIQEELNRVYDENRFQRDIIQEKASIYQAGLQFVYDQIGMVLDCIFNGPEKAGVSDDWFNRFITILGNEPFLKIYNPESGRYE